MNLDPTVSPWIGIVASTGVCLWMVAIGGPLAHAVFRDRPRPVWPFYAPVIGIVTVLLVTNLSAYLIPGAPSAWFGLLAPSVLASVVFWRGGSTRRPSRSGALASLALLLASAGIFVLAFANRTQVRAAEESWHFALVQRMGRGVFPPIAPYGQDAGIGYHYGPDLLAASLANTAGVPPWTAVAVFSSLLVVAMLLAAVGFAQDVGAPLPLAVGSAAILGLIRDPMPIGLPPYVSPEHQLPGLPGLLAGFVPASADVAFMWLHKPHWALALCIVILIAAVLEAGPGRRQAALLAAAAGVAALAEAAVFVFASAALGAVGLFRLTHLRGRQRVPLAIALGVAAGLALFAGGPVSDAVLQRGGQAGLARIAFEPPIGELVPFELAGPALVRLGVLPLLAVSVIVIHRTRSWGLAFLAAASAFGLVAAVFLQSALPFNDARIPFLAAATAALAVSAGVSALVAGLRGWPRRLAIAAVLVLAVLPTAVPRATAGLRMAAENGFAVGQPVAQGPGYPYVGQSRWLTELDRNWDFYAWLADALPNEARLLTPRPAVAASVAGIASPTSARRVQVISSSAMPEYEDALRFLHRDDLADMEITHLHLTDAWESALAPRARQLLDDPAHFRLVADRRSVSGERHRVFEAMPGAGVTEVHPASHRSLRELVVSDVPVIALEGLTPHQSRMFFNNLLDQGDLRASVIYFDQSAIRIPRVQRLNRIPDRGVVALLDHVEPTALGLTRDDAIWAGYGMWVYDLASAWSSVWRVDPHFARLPASLRQACNSTSGGHLDLRLLGEPGSTVAAGPTEAELSGAPQVTRLSVRDCERLTVTSHADLAPFAQLRTAFPTKAKDAQPRAGLGFDGSVDGERAVINLWYRNPAGLPITSGTEFRLYRLGASGAVPRETDPRDSVRWWSAPLTLAVDTQMARIEFDPRRLTLNGDPGVRTADVVPGRSYLLALNVSRFSPETTSLWVQQVIPLVRIEVRDVGTSTEVLSGIVSIEFREVGGPSRWLDYSGVIGWEIDLTPWPGAVEVAP